MVPTLICCCVKNRVWGDSCLQRSHNPIHLSRASVQSLLQMSFELKMKERPICYSYTELDSGETLKHLLCVPQFIVIEFCMFVYVRDELDVFEGELESYVASMNRTGTLTPVLLQMKELINVTKGKTILHLCFCCLCRKQRGTCDLWQVHTYNDYCCWS